ncbi:MAG: hypothetical protein AAGD47_11825 [Pseudomonadota bacterium]
MKRFGLGLGLISVIAVAVWTYHVNYRTRQAFDRISDLRSEMAAEAEAVQVLKVEWAWLNAPQRLKRLVKENNDQLGLVRLEPRRFSFVATVPFPPPEPLVPDPGVMIAQQLEKPDMAELVPSFSAPQPVARPRAQGLTQQVAWSGQ